MGKIPIKIEKIKVKDYNQNDTVKYLFTLEEKNDSWQKTFVCERKYLEKLYEEIKQVLTETTTSEILKVDEKKATIIDAAHAADILCKECRHKMSNDCITCLFELQSPLERKLFLELKKAYIKFNHQYPLNWKGQEVSLSDRSYNNPNKNFKEVLTVVDFFIQKGNVKLCVYTDGHTYHERTEEQALRDRNIDRELQGLGYTVLRYTGKEVNNNPEIIIEDIKKWIQ